MEWTRHGRAAMVVAATLAVAAGPAAAERLFSLADVRGDDDGGGVLIYPNRPDLQQGDLDLAELSAEQRADGVWFAVEMGKPVRKPAGQVLDITGVPVERIARNGFYTFNVDIYVDQDRIVGAGHTDALPGRGVTVDRAYAWEKAIVLTPRPETARIMLQSYYDRVLEEELRAKQGKVSRKELEALEADAEKYVDERYYFPDEVRVSGGRVEFRVPTEFLGGAPAPSWAYTVLVTAADLEQAAMPSQSNPAKASMMTMGVGRGLHSDLWGIRSDDDAGTPPVIDLLASDRRAQARVLGDYDSVSGRLPAVPGLAPDGSVSVAASEVQLTPEQAQRMDAAITRRKPPDGAEPPATPAEKRAAPARLRTLNQLLEDGLITQAEYDELRRKILTEL